MGEHKPRGGLSGRLFGVLLFLLGAVGLLSGAILNNGEVYADPVEEDFTSAVEETTTVEYETDTSQPAQSASSMLGDRCKESLGSVGWLACPVTEKISEAVDWLYDKIEVFLAINPIETSDKSPMYVIWQYLLGLTNLVFVVFLIIVIVSQITGFGITNYGIKKALPKILVVAVLVNLSFVVCSFAVDLSNVIGNSLRGLFESVETATLAGMSGTGEVTDFQNKMMNAEIYGAIAGGSILTAGGIIASFETGAIWMFIPTILAALVAVVTGIVTVALRQALVALLVMISPVAIVCYMLPNTEGFFKKWKNLFVQMLLFYPMFSLLFGASSLAGFAIIASATDGFGVILGTAVEIFPLFFAWTLMKMSGTILGAISSRLQGVAGGQTGGVRAWAESHRMNTRANTLAYGTTPSARLMQMMMRNRMLREKDTENLTDIANSRAVGYVQSRMSGVEIGEQMKERRRQSSRYTRNAANAYTAKMRAKREEDHAEHVIRNFGDYFDRTGSDIQIGQEVMTSKLDAARANMQTERDDEHDVEFVSKRFIDYNDRTEDGTLVDEQNYKKYISSIGGEPYSSMVVSKALTDVTKVQTKQRYEVSNLTKKINFINGFNKADFRSWMAGYKVDGDGWAVDANGKRLLDEDGNLLEVVVGQALTKAPEKLVLYDKVDQYGLYFDFKDQDGKVVGRIHRGIGADKKSYENQAFIKEVLANHDMVIGDSVNDLYSILAGVKPGDIKTPQGANRIGLSSYSTTIGAGLSNYKNDAPYAGAMMQSGVANRQISNAAQHAIWALDSIAKTSKPGAINQQSPASMKFLRTILTPSNWSKIFTEDAIKDTINIDNEPMGGEEWARDENGNILLDENGHVASYTTVENPTYEQRMNRLIRKYCIPAMEKLLPVFGRMTPSTINNQKLGTAEEQAATIDMVMKEWVSNDEIPYDPTLVTEDAITKMRDFNKEKHDRDGNPIYPQNNKNGSSQAQGGGASGGGGTPYYGGPIESSTMMAHLYEEYVSSSYPEDFVNRAIEILGSSPKYARALDWFEQKYNEDPFVPLEEMESWLPELTEMLDD